MNLSGKKIVISEFEILNIFYMYLAAGRACVAYNI